MEKRRKRLRILSTDEIKELYSRPCFANDDRDKYFSLTPAEKREMEHLRFISSKVHFILLLGYFKAKKMFFTFRQGEIQEDVSYIVKTYFLNLEQAISVEVSKPTRLIHQDMILCLLGYKICTQDIKSELKNKADQIVRIFNRPIYIFRELINYLEGRRIVIPGYTFLQDLIGEAISNESIRLTSLLVQGLPNTIKDVLNELLISDDGLSRLAQLRKEPKDFSHKVITEEIQKRESIRPLYDITIKTLPTCDISNENIRQYANMVGYYSTTRLRRIKRDDSYLYLICFIFHRYQKINDDLINAFIYHVNKYINEAKASAKDQVYEYKTEANRYLKDAARVLQLFVDENMAEDVSFSRVKEMAFEMLAKEKFPVVSQYISKMQFDEIEYEWNHYVRLANTFKRNLRQIFLNIDFRGHSSNYTLIQAASFLKEVLSKKNILGRIKPESFPQAIIPEKLKRYICSETGINADKYEFLIYRHLRSCLQAGDVFVDDSLNYRSFEEELIDLEKWKQKDELIRRLEFPYLSDPVDLVLASFEEELEYKLKTVNERIKSRLNPHIKIGKGKNIWKLSREKIEDETNHSFYGELPQVSISDVLHFTNEHCQFINAFNHSLGKTSRSRAEYNSISASILAQGLNIGLTKMDEISDINYSELSSATSNFIRAETLKSANDLVSNRITSLPIFEHYNIKNDIIHSSSDGQKFETQFNTINSRFSPKYFGLKKGISAYTLVANHVPINAKIFGANAHESHYVFDIIYNNTSGIDPDVHSTDTHGTNEVNFAILHIFGYLFAPRYNDLAGRQNMIYGFNNPSFYEDYILKPVRKIDIQLIKDEWENILRIMVSLGQKSTTQAAIIRRLSSYERVNKTKRALWEYDNIIKSMYVLDYIDSLELRQNVQKALNRGEAYHKLRRAISYAHFGKFRVKSESEQQVWNDCSRLIANSIIFYNAYILSELLKQKEYSKSYDEANIIKKISPVAWRHINLYGHYELRRERNSINIDEMINTLGKVL